MLKEHEEAAHRAADMLEHLQEMGAETEAKCGHLLRELVESEKEKLLLKKTNEKNEQEIEPIRRELSETKEKAFDMEKVKLIFYFHLLCSATTFSIWKPFLVHWNFICS